MKLWFVLALAFLVQEPLSTGAVLFDAYRLHYSIGIIHLLFCVATLLDVVIGYYLGVFIDKKFGRQKLFAWIKTKLEKFVAFVGEYGKVAALVVYAPIIFPFSGIFVPWLDISLAEALVFIFIGEVLFWYIPEWFLVLGIKTFATNPLTGILIVAVVSVLLIVIPGFFSKGEPKKNDTDRA
jgi:membrane protein YqaA with SNARE-associated domain